MRITYQRKHVFELRWANSLIGVLTVQDEDEMVNLTYRIEKALLDLKIDLSVIYIQCFAKDKEVSLSLRKRVDDSLVDTLHFNFKP